MSRRIITTQLQASGTGLILDTYTDKLIKYIPADVVAAWTAASGVIASIAAETQALVFWIAFVIGLVATVLWTLRQTSMPAKPPAYTQTAISTIAFVIWVYALGGPFTSIGLYSPPVGSLFLIGYTLLVPLVNPPEG